MWVFPLVASVVALVFAGLLVRRFVERRRPYQLLWALAMSMYGAASLAMLFGVLDGWSGAEFRIYWLLGAILNVPYLAVGELYILLRRDTVVHVFVLGLIFLTAFASSQIQTAALDVRQLAGDLPLGKEVFGDGSLPYRLAQYYAYPAYLLLVGGCVLSALGMRGRRELRERFLGTVWIAVGATVVAAASGIGAGFEIVPLFSAGLAAGIALMFWGFLKASKRHPAI
ncbi:MAG TPA: hypothetical protein VJN50_08595 [Actinomycetota bacterium]|nr:hypothetical protein [Actinomycetota bacterium]